VLRVFLLGYTNKTLGRGAAMPKLERTTYWVTLLIGVPAAVVGAIFTALQFFTREGRPLPPWLAMFNSDFFAWLGQELLYLAILVGLVRLVVMGRTLKKEHGDREKEYQAWIKERGNEISNRCISEYKTLEGRINDFAGTSLRNLETALGGFNARLDAVGGAQTRALETINRFNDATSERLDNASARIANHEEGIEWLRSFVTGGEGLTGAKVKIALLEGHIGRLDGRIDESMPNEELKRDLTRLVQVGIDLQAWIRDHPSTESAQQQKRERVGRWEQSALELLGRHCPAFTEVFTAIVEPPTGTYVLFYYLAVKIERLNALRAALA